jgi:hypothetical protein
VMDSSMAITLLMTHSQPCGAALHRGVKIRHSFTGCTLQRL